LPREKGCFEVATPDAENDLVKESAGALNGIQVTEGDRVETSSEDGNAGFVVFHGVDAFRG
jgi:hypothetical protein